MLRPSKITWQRMQIDRLAAHAPVWARIQPVLDKNRLPHALLLVGPRHANVLPFAHRLMAILLCKHPETAPCGSCQACHLLIQGTHPDIHHVHQDTPNGPIKIDQIRALQNDVYQTPQLGERRFIVVEPADKLNTAAANALLKILEEPPAHTVFILIAEQTHSLPATIMSRCQQYAFASMEEHDAVDYLAIGSSYLDDTPRGQLFQQRAAIVDALSDLVAGKVSPCAVCAQLSGHALCDLLWFLHLLTAQAIRGQLINASAQNSFFTRIPPEVLFRQLDTINSLMCHAQQNIALNQALAIEGLLMGYATLRND